MIPRSVLDRWAIEGTYISLGSGLINDTYLVNDRIVIQRINGNVFANPRRIIENYRRVFDNVIDLVPRLIPTTNGDLLVIDEIQDAWRAYAYYPSRTFDELPDGLCSAAGGAFGLFLERTRNIASDLESSIEGFHNLNHYLDLYQRALRSSEADEKLPKADEAITNLETFVQGQHAIHGDCKVNNLLFDPTESRVLRIVDLDTLMIGHPAWDFGDLVRSISTYVTGEKDEERQKVRIREVCRGFFNQYRLGGPSEMGAFAIAPAYMSYMLGVRFLTDHIKGNVYFKVSTRGENLRRAQKQFALADEFVALRDDIAATITQVAH